ncbi:MAG: glycosyltransferase family 2 protein [Thermaerobacter sp.]|nr:glycosyltransferase family 2 protein [Thermaerobacter sp.]
MMGPRVTIVMLAWNHVEMTAEAVGHVLMNAALPTQLVIVNNASTDGTRAFLDRLPRQLGMVTVQRVDNLVNVGFPAGVNQGLALADGDYVVLLNNDVLVPRQWDRDLVEAFESHPELGLIGPVTNRVTGPQQRSAPYALPEFLDYAALWRSQGGHAVKPVPRLVGFCLMARREVLERIGGLDARFSPGMFEDDDWGVRAQMAGYLLGICTRVYVHHVGSVSFGEDLDGTRTLLRHNGRLFQRKWRRQNAAHPSTISLPLAPAIRPAGSAVMGMASDFAPPARRALAWAYAVGRYGVARPWVVLLDPALEDADAVRRELADAAGALGLSWGPHVALHVESYPYAQYLSRLAVPGSTLVLGGAPMDPWFQQSLAPWGTPVVGAGGADRERGWALVWNEIEASHA